MNGDGILFSRYNREKPELPLFLETGNKISDNK